MTEDLTKRERIERTMSGLEVDRTPITFWRHFPGKDATADDLAAQTLAFQSEYDLDLVKLMPSGMYSVQDYGCTVELDPGDVGSSRLVSGPVKRPDDWLRLARVLPQSGVLGEQVRCVRLVREALGPDVPIIQTLFSPLTMAAKMVGAELERHIMDHQDELAAGLQRMADDVVAFGLACIEAGADGFFFATQRASPDVMPEELYRQFGVVYDLRVLDSLDENVGAWLTMLHLHGSNPSFGLANEYSVDIVNWHDRETEPSITEALDRTQRSLAAGIGHRGVIARGDVEATRAEVRDAIAQSGGRRLIVAPGCVVSLAAPPEALRAARDAV